MVDEIQQAVIRTELKNLTEDLEAFEKYRSYYSGQQKLAYSTEKFTATFGKTFEGFRDNWCKPVVRAVEHKIAVEGFRFEREETELTRQVWEALRRNDIDEQQNDLTNGVLVEGRAYGIVWPDDDLGVRFDWQPAQNVRIRYSETDWRKADWAIKRWRTPTGDVYITIYYPDRIEKYQQTKDPNTYTISGVRGTIPGTSPTQSLTKRTVPGEPWPLPNPFGEVPVVEFGNQDGSELVDVIPQQDALNKILVDMLVTSEFQAFKQRVLVSGANEPSEGWRNDPGRIWHIPPTYDSDLKAVQTQFGTFDASDPGNYVKIVEMFLQHIALTSSTPVRYFYNTDRGGRGDAPSGESLRVEDQQLIDKVAVKQVRLGNAWYKVAVLTAKALTGRYKAKFPLGEPVWRDTQSVYRVALLNEAILMQKLGVPYEFIVKKIGLKPDEVETLLRMGPQIVAPANSRATDGPPTDGMREPTSTPQTT